MKLLLSTFMLAFVVVSVPVKSIDGQAPEARQAKPAADAANADVAFMRTVAMAGMAEVAHGKLAAQNAAHADVKSFAQRMVDDHGKAGDELKALASKKNVTLPTELDQKHKEMQDKLSALKGAAFDRAYMAHMVQAHEQAVELFEKQVKGAQDADTKSWAEKTLPTVQEHLKLAREVNARVGKPTA